ncbi:RNase H domain-containing protein [Trichonephila clavipes]|nr:RNase H domain-containing protein [Trichonephila clavipes]
MCGLSFISNIRDLAFSEICILTDSRSSIQQLSNWPSIGDSTSRSILHLFQQLSDRYLIHLQWFVSHVGLLGNKVTDDLAKMATSNPVDPEDHMVLTSTEIYSRAKVLICSTWVVPPVHPWYFQRHPGSAISFKGSRLYQTAFSRFLTGYLRCLNFEGGKRSFSICPKCNISPFSLQPILQCLGFSFNLKDALDTLSDLQEEAEETKVSFLVLLSNYESKKETVNNTSKNNHVKLPDLPLPTFSGKIQEFEQFKLEFMNLIGNNPSLNEVQKLFYLKGALKNEASLIQKDQDTFDSLMKALEVQYENTRVLVDIHIAEIFSINKLNSENPSQI